MLDSFPGDLGRQVEELVERLGTRGAAVFPVLEAVQRTRGVITDVSFRLAGRALGVVPADLKRLAISSGDFRVERETVHSIVVCVHDSCRDRGALELLGLIHEEVGTSAGGEAPGSGVRVETVRCMGGCKVGPNVLVNGSLVPGMDLPGIRRVLEGIRGRRRRRS